MSNKDFYGQGWKFPPAFDPAQRQTEMVADAGSIRTSLEILMGTSMGERLMQPLYGTNLQPQVFKPGDLSTATLIQSFIRDAIIQYEPRIELNKVAVDNSRIGDGILLVTVDYVIRRTNTRSNIVFPFYLKEGNLIPENLI
jgi:hypothetical protein